MRHIFLCSEHAFFTHRHSVYDKILYVRIAESFRTETH